MIELTHRDLGDEAPELHRRALAGDTEARNRIAEANLRVAGWFAEKYARHYRGLPLDDLIAAACEGVLLAAERYDPACGTRFLTYAQHRIRRCVQMEAARHRRVFGEPYRYCQNPARYLAAHGRDGVLAAHAARLPRGDGEACLPLAACPRPGPAEEAEAADEPPPLARLPWRSLSDLERRVIRLRYGLDDGVERSNADVARLLGVTREAVRQAVCRGLRGLRGGAA